MKEEEAAPHWVQTYDNIVSSSSLVILVVVCAKLSLPGGVFCYDQRLLAQGLLVLCVFSVCVCQR